MKKLFITISCLLFFTNVSAENGNIDAMEAIYHSDYEYYEIKVTGSFQDNQVFELLVNADGDKNSGYGPGIGAEYMVTTGWDIFKYKGPDGGNWDDGNDWDSYWEYQNTADDSWMSSSQISIDLPSWAIPSLNSTSAFQIDTFTNNWDWLDWAETTVDNGNGGGGGNPQFDYSVLNSFYLQTQEYGQPHPVSHYPSDYLSYDEPHLTLETGDYKRFELRQKEQWGANDNVSIVANIKCYSPDNSNEYSWMQVFDEENNFPILRLIWKEYKNGKTKHLWAFLKTPNNVDDEKIDLGRKDDFFNAEININNGRLTVVIDGDVKVDRKIINNKNKNNNWNTDSIYYFKTGVYLSGDGGDSAKVEYTSLELN